MSRVLPPELGMTGSAFQMSLAPVRPHATMRTAVSRA